MTSEQDERVVSEFFVTSSPVNSLKVRLLDYSMSKMSKFSPVMRLVFENVRKVKKKAENMRCVYGRASKYEILLILLTINEDLSMKNRRFFGVSKFSILSHNSLIQTKTLWMG